MDKITEVFVATEETIERNPTAEELAQKTKDATEAKANAEARKAQEGKRQVALEKLAALGLTTDDLQSLGLN